MSTILSLYSNSTSFSVECERKGGIIWFSTKENVSLLRKAKFWISDGTFKSVPHIFYQLYTIHALVGVDDKTAKVFPLVYALMTRRTKSAYGILLQVSCPDRVITRTDVLKYLGFAKQNPRGD